MMQGEYILPLHKFHAITKAEFSEAIQVIERMYQGSGYRKFEKSGSAALIISKLQYLDILDQRIRHLIYTNEQVMTMFINDTFKRAFLYLQYFQFTIAAHDLFEAMSEIEQAIQHDKHIQLNIFRHKTEIEILTNEVKISLLEQCGDVKSIMLPPMTKKQIEICNHLYTMESERIVLNWFLTSMPSCKWFDLLAVYKSKQQDELNTSIELF
jgi:hypothetical protein